MDHYTLFLCHLNFLVGRDVKLISDLFKLFYATCTFVASNSCCAESTNSCNLDEAVVLKE